MRDGRRGQCFHPFRDFAKVIQNGCSLILQRRIVDFSAERSLKDTSRALKEHLNIDTLLFPASPPEWRNTLDTVHHR